MTGLILNFKGKTPGKDVYKNNISHRKRCFSESQHETTTSPKFTKTDFLNSSLLQKCCQGISYFISRLRIKAFGVMVWPIAWSLAGRFPSKHIGSSESNTAGPHNLGPTVYAQQWKRQENHKFKAMLSGTFNLRSGQGT